MLDKLLFSEVQKSNITNSKKLSYCSSHLAACGSSISASITWETSKQLCCCLNRLLKKADRHKKQNQLRNHRCNKNTTNVI